jgi:cytosine deaminase
MTSAHYRFTNARLSDGKIVTLDVINGRFIEAIDDGKGLNASDCETTDLLGRLVVPGFVEGHIHLDTSFYGDTWKPHKPCTAGFDVRERAAFQVENLAASAPLLERARNQLELCLSQGTTSMRSHVMVDGSVGVTHLEAILALREAYRGQIDLELVGFPQHGILQSPGAADYLAQAMDMGCDRVGGLDPAGYDRDIERHLDVVFGLAERHGAGIDIHLHDNGTLGAFQIGCIVDRTLALGMEGRVTISHAYCLGELPHHQVHRLAEQLAKADVSILTNAPGAGPFPPVHLLREAGVNYFGGSDNIRDSWWPWGDGDMLRRANLIGYCSGFKEDWELNVAFDMVTFAGAKALRLEGYGLAPGDRADFVVLDAGHIPEAVVAVPHARDVYKGGFLVASEGRIINLNAKA